MYVKMKELGPIGGGVRPARPPRFANAIHNTIQLTILASQYSDSVHIGSTTRVVPSFVKKWFNVSSLPKAGVIKTSRTSLLSLHESLNIKY